MAEENLTPVSGTQPPAAKPVAMRPSTLKLKPVIRKPTIGGTAAGTRPGMKLPTRPGMKLPTQTALKKPEDASEAPAAPAPMEQLKSVTQKLKGITQQIPQQAILKKTGIIADQDLTAAQLQAAKARTARISLSDAIGVAPVKSESAAPLKTIRIKRPVDIGAPVKPSAPAAAPAAAPEAAAAPAPAAPERNETSITQRKTLKISRPTGTARPSGKFGVKKPAPAAPAAAGADGEVADIPDMPAAAPVAMMPAAPAGDTVPDVPKGMAVVGIILQVAACVAMGALGYFLLQEAQLDLFCGGCGWGR